MANLLSKIKSIFSRSQPQAYSQGGNTITTGYGSGAKFTGGMTSRAPVIMHDHFALRQKAREAMYDSTEAKSLVERYADTVVDTGLKLKPVPLADILGLSEEQAEDWAEKTSRRFDLWARSKNSHKTHVNNFYQNQRMYQVFQQRDNDIFVRLYYSKRKDLFNPLQIDFVDPNQIRGMGYTSTYAQFPGHDDGITKDSDGAEKSFKIWEYDKTTGRYKYTDVPARGERSGRIMMLHGFNPEYAGQTRGYSRFAHALQDIEQLTDFKLSTIQKAINQASFVMAVENEDQDPSNPLENRAAGPIGQYGSNPTPAETAQNVGPDSTEPIMNFTAMPEATLTSPGSTGIFNLKRGDKIQNMKDTSPSAQYDMFVNSFVSHLAASNGMPIEVLLMKFNQNYSASRGALILFWRVAQIWRNEMASDFLDPVYEAWLSEEIASGRIVAPGWSDPLLRAAWLNCEWAGAPMPNIDPLKTATSDQLYAEMGGHTLDDIARNLNGSSGKANRAKNARQFAEVPESPFYRQNKSVSETTTVIDEEE